MSEDERLQGWAEYLRAQYGEGGLVLNARRGIFDPAQGESFCEVLDQMHLPEDVSVDRAVERRFVARLWYIPTSLERNTYRIAKRGGDVWRYRHLTGEVSRAVHHILSEPGAVRLDDAKAELWFGVSARSHQGIGNAEYIAAVEVAFASDLSALGFRCVKALGDQVRYDSDLVHLTVRFRRYASGPSVEMGRLASTGCGLGDVMDALLGRSASAQAFLKAANRSTLTTHLLGLAHLAMAHCRGVLEGRPDALARVDGFYSDRNRKLAEKIIAFNEDA